MNEFVSRFLDAKYAYMVCTYSVIRDEDLSLKSFSRISQSTLQKEMFWSGYRQVKMDELSTK